MSLYKKLNTLGLWISPVLTDSSSPSISFVRKLSYCLLLDSRSFSKISFEHHDISHLYIPSALFFPPVIHYSLNKLYSFYHVGVEHTPSWCYFPSTTFVNLTLLLVITQLQHSIKKRSSERSLIGFNQLPILYQLWNATTLCISVLVRTIDLRLPFHFTQSFFLCSQHQTHGARQWIEIWHLISRNYFDQDSDNTKRCIYHQILASVHSPMTYKLAHSDHLLGPFSNS